jgi:uncharacterized protein YodC (DUF2158 family)
MKKVGDVVRLKSGGPAMTVESTIGGSECMCMWFEGTTLRKKAFPTEALERTTTKGVVPT